MDNATAIQIQAIHVARTGSTTVTIMYSHPIAASSFDVGDYTANITGNLAETFTQISAQLISVGFDGPIASDTQLAYTGNVANLLTPQTSIIS